VGANGVDAHWIIHISLDGHAASPESGATKSLVVQTPLVVHPILRTAITAHHLGMGCLPKPVLPANLVELGTLPVGSVEALRIVHICADCAATHPLSGAAILLEGVVPRIQLPIRPLALLVSGIHAMRELAPIRHADVVVLA